jgi:hypothetical protein
MTSRRRRKERLGEDLGELGWPPLYKAAIFRSEPESGAGYLGTVDVYDREDLSFEALRAEFGGGTLRIKIKDSNGRYLAHRTTKICAPIVKVGHLARAAAKPNPALSRATAPINPAYLGADSPELAELIERFGRLADQVDKLTAALDAYDHQQQSAEQMVRDTLAHADEQDRVPLKARLDELLADLRKLRREVDQGRRLLENVVAVGMMVVIGRQLP